MQISALTDIVEGKLLNSPAISFVTQIHINHKKVNDGDAFFATNELDINKALNNGAFAIIVDFTPNIIDYEIAWIKVDNLTKAIKNILRYKLLKNNIEYIHVDKVFFKFLQIFKTKDLDNIVLLSPDISTNFEILNNIDDDKVVFGTDFKFLKAICAHISTFHSRQYDIQNLTTHSLFETSFSYKDKFFDRLKLPVLYVHHLIQILEVFHYNLDLKKLNNFDFFKPIFINKSTQIVQYGQTNRFILAHKDIDISNIEIDFIKEFYSYANIKIIDSDNYTKDELLDEIKDINYNALYIKGLDIKNIIQILEQNNNISKLF